MSWGIVAADGGSAGAPAPAGRQVMRWMAVIAAAVLGALWLVGCSDPRRVVFYSEKGTLVGPHWSERALAMFDHKEPYAFTLRSGRHKHLGAFGEDLDEVISAGGCD